jgi:hypothetical protein
MEKAGPVCLTPFHSAFVAVLVGVVLAGLTAMMGRVQRMAMCDVSMMTCAFVIAGFMVSRGFAVMFSCGFVMIGSLMMVLGAFVCHGIRLLIEMNSRSSCVSYRPFMTWS